MNHVEKWLKSTPTFDFGNKSIEEKAKDITKGYEEASDKARSLFYFVRDKIKFIPHLPVGVLSDS